MEGHCYFINSILISNPAKKIPTHFDSKLFNFYHLHHLVGSPPSGGGVDVGDHGDVGDHVDGGDHGDGGVHGGGVRDFHCQLSLTED